MTTLSGKEVAGYYHAAGFSGQNLITMVAISKSESGWNTSAHNSKPPDDSYGLSQINMIGSNGPSRRAQYHLSADSDLLNPLINAKVAFGVSGGGTNFIPWSTYTSGDYKKNLGAAAQAVSDLQAAGPQFEHDLVTKAQKSNVHWWNDPNSPFEVIPDPSNRSIVGTGPGSPLANAASAVPDAIKSAANAVAEQFTKIGGNFIAIGVALVLLVVGIILLSHNSIGSAIKAVKP